MRRFVFPLEPVLKLRRVQEDVASRDLVAAKTRRVQEERLLAELRRLWHTTAQELRAAASEGRVEEMAAVGARLEQIRRHIEESEQRLEALRKSEAEKHVRLIEAARQRGVVERLKERQEQAFKINERRRLDKLSDELTVLRKSRKEV